MLAAVAFAVALTLPPVPPGRVADYAGLLDAGAAARIEARLAEHERRTGSQMVVAIFRSLEGEDLEDYAVRLAQQWRIGRAGLDDGVILLVFVDDRRVRLEVGYGLEPVLPDAQAGRIIREVIAPAFRQERYAEGIEGAVEAVYALIAGVPAPVADAPRPPPAVLGLVLLGGAIFVVVMLLAAMSPASRSRRRGYTAGRRGWYVPSGPPLGWGLPRGGRGGGFGGGGFSGGGGSFGGGGASGRW